MSTITLDEKIAAEVASAAVMNLLSQESREKMIQEAIKSLLEPPADRGGYSRKSPIQEAFYAAVRGQAEKVVFDFVEKSEELRAKITSLVLDALSKAVAQSHISVSLKID